jgi:Regulator of chromosome condensation (RCC1) repeat
VPKGRFVQISVGQTSACAIRTNGKLACWGDNYPGFTPPNGRFTDVSVGGGKDELNHSVGFYACGVVRGDWRNAGGMTPSETRRLSTFRKVAISRSPPSSGDLRPAH